MQHALHSQHGDSVEKVLVFSQPSGSAKLVQQVQPADSEANLRLSPHGVTMATASLLRVICCMEGTLGWNSEGWQWAALRLLAKGDQSTESLMSRPKKSQPQASQTENVSLGTGAKFLQCTSAALFHVCCNSNSLCLNM